MILGDGSGDKWGPTTTRFVNGLDPKERFGRGWSKRKQAHLFTFDPKYREWADSLVLLTATASTSYFGTEKLVPPVQHFRRLSDSREARQKALERALSRRKYRAVRVYGVGGDRGYLHRHTAVYVASETCESDFQRWVDAHVDNSPLAQDEAHGSGAVRVDNRIEVDNSSNISSIGAYLMENIPGCDTTGEQEHGIESAPTNVQRSAALLDRVGAEPVTVGPVSPPSSE